MSGMTEIKVDYLANAAMAYARNKADEVAGVVVDSVLNQSGAHVSNLDSINRAEDHTKRFLTALIKNSMIEFTGMWTKELERQAAEFQKLAADTLQTQTPTFLSSGAQKPGPGE